MKKSDMKHSSRGGNPVMNHNLKKVAIAHAIAEESGMNGGRPGSKGTSSRT